MRCSDFLKHYSDYRDGLTHDSRLRRRMTLHMSSCDSCRRYDRAITGGVSLLRRKPGVEPSERFRVRLRCQLALDHRRRRRRLARRARLATSLVASGAVALFAYQAFLHEGDEAPAPRALAPAPMPMVTANPGYPFVTVKQFTAPSLQSAPATGTPLLFLDSLADMRVHTAPVMTVQVDLPR